MTPLLIRSKHLFTLFFICATTMIAQDISRKGSLLFSIGPEYRITPIYNAGLSSYSTEAGYTNPDLQNSGPALNLGLDYYILENLSIGFNNSLRYDLVTTEDSQGSMGQGVSGANRSLLVGYHFKLTYHFKVFRKGDLLVGFGLSLLNRNSEFTIVEPIFDNGQQIGNISYLANYNFSATKISIGYNQGRSKVNLGMYITGNSVYFNQRTTLIIPFLNFSYDLLKL